MIGSHWLGVEFETECGGNMEKFEARGPEIGHSIRWPLAFLRPRHSSIPIPGQVVQTKPIRCVQARQTIAKAGGLDAATQPRGKRAKQSQLAEEFQVGSVRFQVSGGESRTLRAFHLQTSLFKLPANHRVTKRAKQSQFPRDRRGRPGAKRAKQSQFLKGSGFRG